MINTNMEQNKSNRGGWRNGGRPKVEGGTRRMWTVPPDIDEVVQTRGTKWLWEAARFKIAFEKIMQDLSTKNTEQ